MKILSRMYLRQSLNVLALTVCAVLSLSLLFEFFEVVKSASKTDASMGLVIQYLAYAAPRYAVFAIPLGVLLSTMIVLGISARKQELTAVCSLGASLRRMSIVFIVMGFFWTGVTYLLSEYIIPEASKKAVRILTVEIEKKEAQGSYLRDKHWLRMKNGGLAEIDVMSGDEIRGVSLYEFKSGMEKRIEATGGHWEGNRWVLRDVQILAFRDGGMTTERADTLDVFVLPAPRLLREEQRKPDEMTFGELRTYARNLERAGIRADRYRVTLHSKTSFPLVCIAMALLGTGLALRERSGGSRFRMIGLCTAVIVAYWGLNMLMLSLGYVGRIPPVASAWLTPLAFLGGGSFLFLRAERIQ